MDKVSMKKISQCVTDQQKSLYMEHTTKNWVNFEYIKMKILVNFFLCQFRICVQIPLKTHFRGMVSKAKIFQIKFH